MQEELPRVSRSRAEIDKGIGESLIPSHRRLCIELRRNCDDAMMNSISSRLVHAPRLLVFAITSPNRPADAELGSHLRQRGQFLAVIGLRR